MSSLKKGRPGGVHEGQLVQMLDRQRAQQAAEDAAKKAAIAARNLWRMLYSMISSTMSSTQKTCQSRGPLPLSFFVRAEGLCLFARFCSNRVVSELSQAQVDRSASVSHWSKTSRRKSVLHVKQMRWLRSMLSGIMRQTPM